MWPNIFVSALCFRFFFNLAVDGSWIVALISDVHKKKIIIRKHLTVILN